MVDTTMTPEAAVALQQTQILYAELSTRRTEVELEERYYAGDQPLRFASKTWREYHADRYEMFSDNWCAPVANTPNERLRSIGFRLDDSPQRSDEEKLLWGDWLGNDMEAQSSQGWLHSIVARRSFVLVWGRDDDEPVDTWERADQCIIGYDPEFPSRRLAALKTWCDGSTEFATLYTADLVWKWQRPQARVITPTNEVIKVPPGSRGEGFFNIKTPDGLWLPGTGDGGGWSPRQPKSDNAWPLPNPLGVVPMVEMPNRPLLGASPTSEISGTRAMQDAINLLWAYLFNAADGASFPARVVMGAESPKLPILDANGQKVGEKPADLKKLAEDRILWLTGQNTKIGQWDSAKLDVFTAVIEVAVSHIAAQTRTPPNMMILGKGMVNVSADGMKAAALGQVNKVQEMQLFLSPPTREVHRLNALVRGDKKLAAACRTGVVVWKDAENHSEAQLVDSLQKMHAMGFPFAWIAERYGLSQPEVDRLLDMRMEQAALDPVGMMSKAIGQGQPPPPVEE